MHRRIRPLAAALVPALLAACASQPAPSPRSSIDRVIDDERLSHAGRHGQYAPITINAITIRSRPKPAARTDDPSDEATHPRAGVRCELLIMADGDAPVSVDDADLEVLLGGLSVRTGDLSRWLFTPLITGEIVLLITTPSTIIPPHTPTLVVLDLGVAGVSSDVPADPAMEAYLPDPDRTKRLGFTQVTITGPVRLE